MNGTVDLVIGIGSDRGDDAAGWAVLDLLPDRVPTYRSDGEPARLMEAWRSGAEIAVIDAMRSGEEPGSIFIFDAIEHELPLGVARSSHGLGLAEAVELARAVDVLPSRLWVIGIEGQTWETGAGLSPAVSQAVPRAAGIVAMLASEPG